MGPHTVDFPVYPFPSLPFPTQASPGQFGNRISKGSIMPSQSPPSKSHQGVLHTASHSPSPIHWGRIQYEMLRASPAPSTGGRAVLSVSFPETILMILEKFPLLKNPLKILLLKGSSENRGNVNRKLNIVRIMQFELFQCQWTRKIYEIS